jgi:hypothetical protein
MPVSFISVRTKFDTELHALCDPSALELSSFLLCLSLSLSPSVRPLLRSREARQCVTAAALTEHVLPWATAAVRDRGGSNRTGENLLCLIVTVGNISLLVIYGTKWSSGWNLRVMHVGRLRWVASICLAVTKRIHIGWSSFGSASLFIRSSRWDPTTWSKFLYFKTQGLQPNMETLDDFEGRLWAKVNQHSIHWMPVITQLWMNLNRVNIWFHLG